MPQHYLHSKTNSKNANFNKMDFTMIEQPANYESPAPTELSDGTEAYLREGRDDLLSLEAARLEEEAAKRRLAERAMERPLAPHETIGETTRLVINIRLEKALEYQAPTRNPDDYELINDN
jgi:hypothetical protein